MEWIFSGIGTEISGIIVSSFVSILLGGFVGFKIGIKYSTRQKQIAANNSNQVQISKLPDKNRNTKSSVCNKINQRQKANDCSSQIQIGGINDARRN